MVISELLKSGSKGIDVVVSEGNLVGSSTELHTFVRRGMNELIVEIAITWKSHASNDADIAEETRVTDKCSLGAEKLGNLLFNLYQIIIISVLEPRASSAQIPVFMLRHLFQIRVPDSTGAVQGQEVAACLDTTNVTWSWSRIQGE